MVSNSSFGERLLYDGIFERYIDETELPMPSNRNITLWRYLDVSKLAQLLEDKALYLRRVTDFEDRLEGKLPIAHEQEWIAYFLKAQESYDVKIAKWHKFDLDRWTTYASCWRMDENECMRAWDEYKAQIAIHTSLPKLAAAFKPTSVFHLEDSLKMGMVTYIDRLSKNVPTDKMKFPLLVKDTSYMWEKEIRIIKTLESKQESVRSEIFNNPDIIPSTPVAIGARISLNNLIEGIVLCPGASEDIIKGVNELLEMHNLNIPLIKSESRQNRLILNL